jgi:hypothetical protein
MGQLFPVRAVIRRAEITAIPCTFVTDSCHLFAAVFFTHCNELHLNGKKLRIKNAICDLRSGNDGRNGGGGGTFLTTGVYRRRLIIIGISVSDVGIVVGSNGVESAIKLSVATARSGTAIDVVTRNVG